MEKIKLIRHGAAALALIALFAACSKSSYNPPPPSNPVYFDQADAVGRPAINTVFIPMSGKDSFNTTIPSLMAARFTMT